MKRLSNCLNLGIFSLPCFFILSSIVLSKAQGTNDRPIIGILAQETTTRPLLSPYGDSQFFGSYVKLVELGGAQAVPVRINEAEEYYETLFGRLNGVLFPGGAVSLTSSLYAKTAKKIYDFAVKANDNGDYFPLLGICLGFELLTVLTLGEETRVACDGADYSIPLLPTEAFLKSRMYGGMAPDLLDIITHWNVTYNHHSYCVSSQTFQKSSSLRNFYKVTTENTARDDVRFVSSIEAKSYPFYGIQWHPEKNIFTWDHKAHINHSIGAVRVTQHVANFIVSEARKSQHSFPSEESEASSVIDNYEPVFIGLPSLRDIYFFNFSHETDYQDDLGFDWIGFHVSERCKRGLKIMLMMFVIVIVMVTLGILLRRWLQLNNQALSYQHLLGLSQRFALLDHGANIEPLLPQKTSKLSQCTFENAPEKISIAVPD